MAHAIALEGLNRQQSPLSALRRHLLPATQETTVAEAEAAEPEVTVASIPPRPKGLGAEVTAMALAGQVLIELDGARHPEMPAELAAMYEKHAFIHLTNLALQYEVEGDLLPT